MKLTLIALGGTLTAALANRINTNTEVFNATSVGLEPRDSEWMHFCPNDWEMRCCIGGTVFDENCRAEDTLNWGGPFVTDDSNGSRDICRGAPHRSKVAATCCKIPKPGERDACYIPCTWNTYKKSWSSYIDGCSEKLAEFGEAPRDAANSEEANNTNTKAGSFNSIELDFKSTPAALAPRALPVATINNMEANLNVTETGFNAAAADLESRQYRGTWMHFCPGNLEMYCCNKPGYWAADGYDLVDTCKEGNAVEWDVSRLTEFADANFQICNGDKNPLDRNAKCCKRGRCTTVCEWNVATQFWEGVIEGCPTKLEALGKAPTNGRHRYMGPPLPPWIPVPTRGHT